MASVFSALDSFTSTRIGENNHTEFDWSNDLKEKVVQFDFQCVRTITNGVSNLVSILDGLLYRLSRPCDLETKPKRDELLVSLYKMIGKTRDINGGKGEYTLSYMMLFTWYKYYPKLAIEAFQMFVMDPKRIYAELDSQEPYGSWKDMKYFCKYVLDNGGTMEHELIDSCIKCININLRLDNIAYEHTSNKKTLTLASKWIPRESSKKFGFLYDALAKDYFPEYIATAKTEVSKKKALDKCRAQYRMLCSKLNRHLDTVQIKQCGKSWAAIEHAKTTSITISKQRNAFLNKKNDNSQRSEDPDRIQCAENLRAHLMALKMAGKEVKGKHVALNDFTQQAKNFMSYNQNIEDKHILNSQWRDNSNKKNANGLGPMVAMVDLSGSMYGDPMNAAIALGCRVAEKSILGRRVMTFSDEPSWINLDGKTDFTDMVREIYNNTNSAGVNTDFYKALDMILAAIEQNRVPPSDAENMILAIFSDMQIDDNLCYKEKGGYNHTEEEAKVARGNWSVMHEQIKQKYAAVGMRLYGEPLKTPHILFWNLRNTGGFPTMSSEAGCSMMSGFDPTILNAFCEMGMDALKDITPYNMLLKQLDNPRYIPLEKVIVKHLATA